LEKGSCETKQGAVKVCHQLLWTMGAQSLSGAVGGSMDHMQGHGHPQTFCLPLLLAGGK
jgi:hypothetical protein